MITRFATVADATELGRLHVRAWQRAYRDILPTAVLDALSPRERADRWEQTIAGQRPPRPAVVVVCEGSALLGLAHLVPSRDEDAQGQPTAELTSIYVHPEHWQRGAGTLLHTRLVELAATAHDLDVSAWVLAANHPAQRFYEARGWRPDGARRVARVGGMKCPEIRYRLRIG